MKQQRRVETVEEFKLRIAAIIGAKPDQIPAGTRPHGPLIRGKKRAGSRKSKTSSDALAPGFMHVYEVRPRKDKRGVDLLSDGLPFGPALVWRAKRCQQCSRVREALHPSHDVVTHVYDQIGDAIVVGVPGGKTVSVRSLPLPPPL